MLGLCRSLSTRVLGSPALARRCHYYGPRKTWKEVRVQDLPELQIKARHLQHEPSGAGLVYLEADDEINAFSVHFRTVPHDSTGICHILEHVTLCGSEKYPVRDPFFKMLQRSLSTFMNAMTGPDYTLYPFSTPNEKDYFNLLNVYLDAVFRPKLKEQDFRQEGWRLEQENLEDRDSKLILKGVVFNEMKGVFASAENLFARNLHQLLLPSHSYGNESGGLPENIPDLTWSALRKFHQNHYNPTNAKFYVYGKLPLETQLDVIERYLPNEGDPPLEKIHPVPREPRWNAPRAAHISCAPNPANPPGQEDTLAVSFALSDINDSYENFVLAILCELLIDGPNAPFYQALLESRLGTSYAPGTGFGSHFKDTSFTIGVQGCDLASNRDDILSAIQNTLETATEKEFDSKRIEAIVHKTELSLKNKSEGFGLNVIMAATLTWNHDDADPTKNLHINQNVQRFQKDLKANPRFLQEKVEQYFLKNTHRLTLTMSPEADYNSKYQAKLDAIETKLSEALSEEERNKLLQEGKQLAETQSRREDLSCLPNLQMTDIAKECRKYPTDVIQMRSGVPTILSKQPTNEIAFFRALLSTETLPSHLTPYLSLFTSVLMELGAGEMDYRQFDIETDLRTGGLSASLHYCETPGDIYKMRQGLFLSSHCLDRNSDRMFDLWQSLFTSIPWESSNERLKVLVSMMASSCINGISARGHSYAMGSARAGLTPGANIREEFSGLPGIRFLNDLAKRENLDDVLDKLKQIGDILLNKKRMKVALTTTENHADEFVDKTEQLLQNIKGTDPKPPSLTSHLDFQACPINRYVVTPFPVHYCSTAVPGVGYLHDDFAKLRILSNLLSLKFLHTEIREKGGAYGGGCSLSSGGTFAFYSYRDPNFEQTLNTFRRSKDWIFAKDSFSDEDIMGAKLGVFKGLDAPTSPGSRGLRHFVTEVTDEMFDEHRRQLKAVDAEQIRKVAEKYLDFDKVTSCSTVIGPEKNDLGSEWTREELA